MNECVVANVRNRTYGGVVPDLRRTTAQRLQIWIVIVGDRKSDLAFLNEILTREIWNSILIMGARHEKG